MSCPQPHRSFTVTYSNKGQEQGSLSTAQVTCREEVATPRPDLNLTVQIATMEKLTSDKKLARVRGMLLGLELSRKSHQIHLKSLVNEAGRFQRRCALLAESVVANDGPAAASFPRPYKRPDTLMLIGAATLSNQGLPSVNPYRKPPTFMLASQPKLWGCLLADIATLLADPTKNPPLPGELPATPKFVADQVHGLFLFQQSNFVV